MAPANLTIPTLEMAPSQSSVATSATPKSMASQSTGVEHGVSTASLLVKKNDTCFAKLSDNTYFENFTLGVIVINALWICIDVEWNHPNMKKNGKLPLEPVSTVIENLFCVYFTFEVVVRFLAFLKKWMCIFDGWFVFDGLLVSFMVIETWLLPIVSAFSDSDGGGGVLSNFSSFRLLRLLRLTRMARIMRFFPELMTIVKGMVNAAKAVSFVLLFLILCMYVFAIVFTSQLGKPNGGEQEESPDGCDQDPTAFMMFASLGSSMMTLFTNGVLGDNLAQTLDAIKDTDGGIILLWLFIVFMCISSITLLNMLIGVLCTVVEGTAQEEEETKHVFEFSSILRDAFHMIDLSSDGLISAEEWKKIGQSPNVRKSFMALGVEEAHMDERLTQMEHTLFGRQVEKEIGSQTPRRVDGEHGGSGICYEDFIGKVVDLRWDTPTSALDLEMLKRSVLQENKFVRGKLDIIEARLEKEILPLIANRGLASSSGENGKPSTSTVTANPAPALTAWESTATATANPVPALTAWEDTAKATANPVPTLTARDCPELRSNALEGGAPQLPGAVLSPGGGALELTNSPGMEDEPRPLNLREVPAELLFHMLETRYTK